METRSLGGSKSLTTTPFACAKRPARALLAIGATAVPQLEAAVRSDASAELRLSGRRILRAIAERGSRVSPAELQQLRAIAALEMLGTPAAADELQRLTGGDGSFRQTEHARTAPLAIIDARYSANEDNAMKLHCLAMIVGLMCVLGATANGVEKVEHDLPRGAVARLGDSRFKVSGNIQSLAWSPDGRWIAAGISNGRGVYVWDAATGQLHRKLPETITNHVEFSPDGAELHASSQAWYRWKTDDWSALANGPLGVGPVQRDWPFLPAHGWKYRRWYKPDDMVDIVDLPSGDVLVRMPRKARIDIDIAQATGVVAMYTGDANFRNGYVEVWDIAKKAKRHRFDQMTESPGHFAITPDGKRLIAGGYLLPLHVWNLETGEYLGEVEKSIRSSKMLIPPDGQHVLVADSDGPAVLIDVATLKLAHRANLGGFPRGVAFSPDGAAIAIGVGNSVGIWDRRSGEFQRPGESATLPINNLTTLADGIVLASSDNETAVWNLAERKRLKVMRALARGECGVSPDGQWLAATDRGGLVRLIPLAEPDKQLVLPLANSLQISATSTRNGQVLAMGTPGGLIEIGGLRRAPNTPPRKRFELRARMRDASPASPLRPMRRGWLRSAGIRCDYRTPKAANCSASGNSTPTQPLSHWPTTASSSPLPKATR